MSRINKRSGDIDFLSIAEGGTGASSMAAFKTNNNILPKNSPKAVILGPGGAFPTSAQFTGDIAGKPILTGSFEGIPNQTLTYTISNFDSFTNYTVSSTDGAISIVDDVITFVPGNNTSGNIYFTVNNNSYTVAISSLNPTAPTIQLSGLSDGVQTVITVQGSGFTSPANATLTSMSVQVATDPSFATVVGTSNAGLTPNITVNSVGVFYVRAKFIDSASRESNWSAVKNIDSATLSNTIATPTMVVKATKNGTGAKFEITGSAFYETTGKTHKSTIYQISGNAGFTDIIYNNTDSTNKTLKTITVPDQKTTYYVRIKYVSSNDGQSGWSSVYSVNYVDMALGIPKNEETILRASPTYSVTYFGNNCVTDATGTRLLVTGNNGVMNIFVRNGSVWTVEFSYAFSAGGSYANSCAIDDSGTRVFLSNSNGYVYIFVRNNTTWTLELELTSSDSNTAYFSNQIATNPDGSIIVVTDDSKTDNGSSGKGSCYVYKRTGTSWSKVAKLNLSNTGTEYKSFGSSMAYSEAGSTIILKSKFYSDYSVVWAFTGSGDTWSEGVLLSDPGGSVTKSVRFGDRLIISQDGTRIFISDTAASAGNGSTGVVFCYVKSGNNWVYESTITSPESNSYYFSTGALSCNYDGSVLAVGSSHDPVSVNVGYGGRVFIYSRTGATWSTTATITASDTSGKHYFGQPISLAKDGSRLFCASRYHGNGDVHVFS